METLNSGFDYTDRTEQLSKCRNTKSDRIVRGRKYYFCSQNSMMLIVLLTENVDDLRSLIENIYIQ